MPYNSRMVVWGRSIPWIARLRQVQGAAHVEPELLPRRLPSNRAKVGGCSKCGSPVIFSSRRLASSWYCVSSLPPWLSTSSAPQVVGPRRAGPAPQPPQSSAVAPFWVPRHRRRCVDHGRAHQGLRPGRGAEPHLAPRLKARNSGELHQERRGCASHSPQIRAESRPSPCPREPGAPPALEGWQESVAADAGRHAECGPPPAEAAFFLSDAKDQAVLEGAGGGRRRFWKADMALLAKFAGSPAAEAKSPLSVM